MTSEQKFDDADQSVYSSHVLYVLPNDPKCSVLTSRLEPLELGDNMYVQNVQLMAQRPPWLRGVPTLYARDTHAVITGARDILAYATTWKNPDLAHNPTSHNSGWASSLGGSSLNDSIFSIEDDPTPTSTTKPKGERAERKANMAAAANLAVEQLRAARSQPSRWT